MPIETANYINQLVPANPLDTDPEGQGAAQMRLVKAAVQNTFPNLTGPITATQAAINAMATITATPGALTVGPDPNISTNNLGGSIYLIGATPGVPSGAIQTSSGALTLYTQNAAGTGLEEAMSFAAGPAGAVLANGPLTIPGGGLQITGGGNIGLTAPNGQAGGVLVAGAGTAGVYAGGVPLSFVGEIRLWSGPLASIPTGWHLCDGTNGTPDLRNNFVVGAGSSYGQASSGGAANVTLSLNQIPQHSHTISDPGHTHAVTDPGHTHTVNDPGHTHTASAPTGTEVSTGTVNSLSGTASATAITTSSAKTNIGVQGAGTGITLQGSSTGITGTAAAGGGASFSILPPFVALAYIMRTA